MDDLTRDAFLGGLVQLLQPRVGYRAGVDPVLLAASVPAQAGQSVLDLGCGVGAAALCLGARIAGLSLTGVEMQAEYAQLAARNGGGRLEVVVADLNDLPADLRERQFDHVMANPPYFDRKAGLSGQNAAREAALGEATPLAVWIKVAAKRVKPKGQVHFIHRAERIPQILEALPDHMGSIEILPISPRIGRAAELVILRARKNGRAAFKLHAPLILHEGARHLRDGDSYAPRIKAILRDGTALDF
ncbi:tRNA1(Val) (adenine(37)-N6)-methyltransferase [Roseobacter fucihabitans]|uniref:tRNA1(Val) (Adenine(37)-N6)-methyltransferase n=2 Tax=Roseobacter fucihabitans TaxID=1537242 RepID=A0ABZ2BQW8_9RHOB|nr:tRNA1(Val) (adenine(37)-N6)-methyltransferase [Roseobacter litoralis]